MNLRQELRDFINALVKIKQLPRVAGQDAGLTVSSGELASANTNSAVRPWVRLGEYVCISLSSRSCVYEMAS